MGEEYGSAHQYRYSITSVDSVARQVVRCGAPRRGAGWDNTRDPAGSVLRIIRILFILLYYLFVFLLPPSSPPLTAAYACDPEFVSHDHASIARRGAGRRVSTRRSRRSPSCSRCANVFKHTFIRAPRSASAVAHTPDVEWSSGTRMSYQVLYVYRRQYRQYEHLCVLDIIHISFV